MQTNNLSMTESILQQQIRQIAAIRKLIQETTSQENELHLRVKENTKTATSKKTGALEQTVELYAEKRDEALKLKESTLSKIETRKDLEPTMLEEKHEERVIEINLKAEDITERTESKLNEAVCHLKRCDSTMAQLIEVVGKCRLDEKQRKVSFAALARSIVSQQLSVQAAKKTYQRLTKTLGQPKPRSILEADPKMLRDAGLSWQKVSYMIDLAEKVESGTLLLDKLQFLPDEEVVGELTQVKGVGVWTAQMFLIFHLGRLDVLPVGDLGVRNGFRDAYGLDDLPNNETMERIAEPWKPYRSIGAWYLWRFKDTVEADV